MACRYVNGINAGCWGLRRFCSYHRSRMGSQLLPAEGSAWRGTQGEPPAVGSPTSRENEKMPRSCRGVWVIYCTGANSSSDHLSQKYFLSVSLSALSLCSFLFLELFLIRNSQTMQIVIASKNIQEQNIHHYAGRIQEKKPNA